MNDEADAKGSRERAGWSQAAITWIHSPFSTTPAVETLVLRAQAALETGHWRIRQGRVDPKNGCLAWRWETAGGALRIGALDVRLPFVAYAEDHRVDTVRITTGPVDPNGDAPTWRLAEGG